MFCPNCGQQQLTQDLRFCSKCGLPLSDIKDLVLQGGISSSQAVTDSGYRQYFTKLYGSLFGVLWFIIFTLLLTSLAAILDLGELPALLAVTGVFGSLIIILFSVIILPASRKPKESFAAPPQPQHYFASPQANSNDALPPQQAANFYPLSKNESFGFDTGEIKIPASVTESTTKLLKREED